MLESVQLPQILFLDIETVPQQPSYNQLTESEQHLWSIKATKLDKEKLAEDLYERAGIYAEFGKIVCISVGFFVQTAGEQHFRIKSFASENETEVLNDFANLLNLHFCKKEHLLCAHNGKEFDFPYIARRMLISDIKLPLLLNIAGKKPWEIAHLDTMELWRFGDYKSYTSLALLASIFHIPTPKDDIDGSQVGAVFWQDHDLPRIVSYCQKDVLTVAQLLLRFKGMPILKEGEYTFV